MLGELFAHEQTQLDDNKKHQKAFLTPYPAPAKLNEQDCSPLTQQVWQDPWQDTPVSHTGCILVCTVSSTTASTRLK